MKVMNRILIGLFAVFIGGISILHPLTKDVYFSESENRVLAQMPKFTWKQLASGNFTKEFESYVSDQFIKKGFWTGTKSVVEKAVGKRENNGVYFGKDGYLFERFEKPGEQLNSNVDYMNRFSGKIKGANTFLMLVPTSIEMYPEKLPRFAYTESEKYWMDVIQQLLNPSTTWLNAYNPLWEAKDEPIYFRTDHHWTTHGAFIAYQNAANAMGFQAFMKEDFTIETVSKNFFGTYDAKANDFTVKADKIEMYVPKFDVSYRVEFNDDTQVMDSLYAHDFLQKRDQYSFFLNGNHGKVVINSSVKNGRKLLVVKDSYAHALMPFLANHYEEIHMIDLRYYHEKLDSYIEKETISDVLFLYNIATFSEDPNLIWLNQ